MRRRTILASAAGLCAGGIGVAQIPDNTTAATVQQNTLTVGNRSHNTEQGEITDVIAEVEAEITIDASEAPDSYKVSLVGGPTEASPAVLTYVGGEFTQASETVTETLSASVLNHDALSVQDFRPPEDSTVTQELQIGLRLDVRSDNETIAEDETLTTATVTVSAPAKMTVATTLSGSGNVVLETES